jgi:hypothetical protein
MESTGQDMEFKHEEEMKVSKEAQDTLEVIKNNRQDKFFYKIYELN